MRSKKVVREHLDEPLVTNPCPRAQPALGTAHRDDAVLAQPDDVPDADVAPLLPAEAAGGFRGQLFVPAEQWE